MKKSIQEINSEKAFSVCQKIKENEKIIRDKTIENIPLYKECFLNEYYKVDLGDENASWNMFLGLPEVTRPRAQIRSWFVIMNNLVDKFGFSLEELMGVKLSKLEIIAIYAKDKKEAEKLINDAKILAPSEWKDIENELRGKPTSDDGHKHDFKRFKQCKICGLKSFEDHEH